MRFNHRAATITINGIYQSRWVNEAETRSLYQFLSMTAWQTGRGVFYATRIFLQIEALVGRFDAQSIQGFIQFIRSFAEVNDDIPYVSDDPKRLCMGFFFPKTNFYVSCRLSVIKAAPREDANMLQFARSNLTTELIKERQQRQNSRI